MFNQVSIDSGSLSVLGSIAHRIAESGCYHGLVLNGQTEVGRFTLNVSNNPVTVAQTKGVECDECNSSQTGGDQNQVNIDLKQLDLPGSQHVNSQTDNAYSLKTGGHVVFHVTSGTCGYAVEIHKTKGEQETNKVFDSRELKDQDIFSTLILRPGTYKIANIISNAEGELTILYPEIGKTPRNPTTVSVELTGKNITPNKIEIHPNQGLIFKCTTPSRIKIELIKPLDKPVQVQPGGPKATIIAATPAPARKVIRRLRYTG